MGIAGDDGRSGTGGCERRGFAYAGATDQGRRTPTLWAAIAARSLRRGRHHLRLVTVAAVVAVVVAVAADGCVGLTSKDTASSAGSKKAAALHGANAPSTSPHGVLATGAPGGAAGSGSTSPGIIACPMTPGVADMTGGNQSLGSATHLFTRTTADGVTIRAYRLSSTEPCGCGPIPYGSATSPSSGSSSGSGASSQPVPRGGSLITPATSLEFSDDSAVGQGVLFGALGAAAPTTGVAEPLAVISNAFGVPEGAPVWWIAASVGPEVASAQMTFADGSTDEMSPIDGVVVLARQIDASVASSGEGPNEVSGTLQLLDTSGTVINTVSFPAREPPPVPFPVPDTSTPPTPVAGSIASSAVPTRTSPSTPNGPMIVCPETVTPTEASAG